MVSHRKPMSSRRHSEESEEEKPVHVGGRADSSEVVDQIEQLKKDLKDCIRSDEFDELHNFVADIFESLGDLKVDFVRSETLQTHKKNPDENEDEF